MESEGTVLWIIWELGETRAESDQELGSQSYGTNASYE